MNKKFLFKRGFEVFSTEEYVITNPISARDYAQTYRLARKRDGKAFLMKVYLTDDMPKSLLFRGVPNLIAYLNSSGIASYLSIISWGSFTSEDGKSFPFTISEYFERGPVSDVLTADGPMDAERSIKTCLDIAEILHGLRTPDGHGFVHCDLCTDNIMLGRDRNGDFKAFLIDNDHLVHTGDDGRAAREPFLEDIDLRFSASETFSASGTVANSDVFSLGVVLYNCFFGTQPWSYGNAIRYRRSRTSLKMGMIICGRNDSVPCCSRKEDGWEEVITDIFNAFTAHDDDSGLQDSRPDIAKAHRMLLAAYLAIRSRRPDTVPYTAYRNELEGLESLRYGGIYGPVTSGPAPAASEGNVPGQKVTGSPDADAEFTNVELGYIPMVRAHDPAARGFADVAGMEELKTHVKKRVLFFLDNPGLAEEYKIDYPNGMLLYGPPGCGKTFFARKFAEESKCSFALVKASDLGSTWVHGSQGKIAMLFREARAKAPCMLCFDEFDAFAPRRDTIQNANLSGEVNEFLSQLDNCGKDGVFVIATTNNPEGIDTAVLRSGRLDHRFYIPAPDVRARREIFRIAVEKRPHDKGIDYSLLARKTEDYVTSDISLIVNDAAMNAAYSRTPISEKMLLQSIANYRPSVSRSILREHEEIHVRMESEVYAKIPLLKDDKILT